MASIRSLQVLSRRAQSHLGHSNASEWLCRPAPRPLHRIPPRMYHSSQRSQVQRAVESSSAEELSLPKNQPMSFPCLDAVESRSETLSQRSSSGPEPSYTTGEHLKFHSSEPFLLDWGGVLPGYDIAYEAWGTLNAERSNAILLHTGLSASSHAHSTATNTKPGWWEKFIGSGKPLDTDKYCVICTNVIGGCYGSTGPSSIDPSGDGQQRYGTRFPILTMHDMVRAQFRLLDHLGIRTLYASVGASMGGMQSLAAGVLFPERVGKIVSISGCARSHPYSIAMRHTQRQVLMVDPNWARGFYYDKVPPHTGMKLAREIATVTYRSGPEWEQRFGRRRADATKPPALCPDFLIETYLDHAGEKWCLEYDANSLLYISKAMDLFDLGAAHQQAAATRRQANEARLAAHLHKGNTTNGDITNVDPVNNSCALTIPDTPYQEQPDAASPLTSANAPLSSNSPRAADSTTIKEGHAPADLITGLAPLARTPALILGVASDTLFPAWQQREVADALRRAGNEEVVHVELSMEESLFGHDTFLLDLKGVGGALGKFLG